MTKLGEWLRMRRREKGLTQEGLAKLAGISMSYISTIERDQPHGTTGAAPQPARDKIEALAAALGADKTEALKLAGYLPDELVLEVKNAQEFLSVLQSHGLKIPNFLNGIAGLEQVGEEELNEVLGAMLFQLKLKADKKLLH